MSFQFIIRPLGFQPNLFQFETLEQAMAACDFAIEHSYYRIANFALKLGPGTLFTVMSDEASKKAEQEDMQAAKSNGLVLQDRFAFKDGFMLATQFGGNALPPLHFAEMGALNAVVDNALKSNVLRYVFEEGHDYFFIMIGTGMSFVSMATAEYNNARRQAIAEAERRRNQAMRDREPQPKIVLR